MSSTTETCTGCRTSHGVVEDLREEVARLKAENEELRRDKTSFRDHSDESRRNLARMREELELRDVERQKLLARLERAEEENEFIAMQLEEAAEKERLQGVVTELHVSHASPSPTDGAPLNTDDQGKCDDGDCGLELASEQSKPEVAATAVTRKRKAASMGVRSRTPKRTKTGSSPKRSSVVKAEPTDSETECIPLARDELSDQPHPREASTAVEESKHKVSATPQVSLKSKKDGPIDLPTSVVEAYLKNVPRFVVHPEANLVRVRRDVMSQTYGGSSQHLVQYIPAADNPSSNTKRNPVWPMPHNQSATPRAPGEPGLVFAGRPELREGTWSLFTKNANKARAEWTYMGEYENTLAGTMTKEQFAWQSGEAKRNWVKRVATKKSDPYIEIRARIALRKAEMLPVDDKEQEAAAVEDEVKRQKDGSAMRVTEEDVMDAFIRGDEGITILRSRCVAYDRQFVDHIEGAHQTPPAAVSEEKYPKASRRSLRSKPGPVKELRRRTQTKPRNKPVYVQVQSKEEDSDGGLSYISEAEAGGASKVQT